MAPNDRAGLGSFKRSCEHLVLFSFGFLAGYVARDFVYWHWGQQCSTVHWLQQATSGPSPWQASASVKALRAALAARPALSVEQAAEAAVAVAAPEPPEPCRPLELAAQEPAELPMPPPPAELAELCKVARRAAIGGQVLVFVGDRTTFKPLSYRQSFFFVMMKNLLRLKINNTLLIATDPGSYQSAMEWAAYLRLGGVRLSVVRQQIPAAGNVQSKESWDLVRAKKFPAIRDILRCSVNVLFSDLDVLLWENPFKYLVGDADVEAMSDGASNETIYGLGSMWETKKKKWHPWEWKSDFLNSGFFYVRPSQRTVKAMQGVWDMMVANDISDYYAYNAQLRGPLGTPEYSLLRGAQALRLRIMNSSHFPNSRLFNEIVDRKHSWWQYAPRAGTKPSEFAWPSDTGRPVALRMSLHRNQVGMMAWARRAIPFPKADGQ